MIDKMTPPYQFMPPLSDEEFAALKEDIQKRGIIIPIEIDENGEILDGHHRLKAWAELRDEGILVPDYPRVVRAGMTEARKRNHVRALNIIRRHLSKEKRKELWADMRADGKTYEAIAEATGVDHSTVLRSVGANAQTQPAVVVGKDGKTYPAKKKKRRKPPKPPEAPSVSVYAISDRSQASAINKARKTLDSPTAASQHVHATIFSSEEKEYYTPPQYIEAAREVMGGIDLDPASCDAAQEWIRADKYYTVKEDGLTQEWSGKVWLNPPYGKDGNESNQMLWSNRVVEGYLNGSISEAILLVKAALGYHWFEDLWIDWPTCCARERVSFIRPGFEDKGQSKIGTAFIYFGPHIEKFKSVFTKFGRIIMPEDIDKWQNIVKTLTEIES